MKLVLLGIPSGISDERLTVVLGEMSVSLNVDINVNILDEAQFIPKSEKRIPVKYKTTKSRFVQAMEGVIKTCGSPIEDIPFRAEFYKQSLDRVIERPILEILAFGPKDCNDLAALAKNSAERLPEYAKIALSLIELPWERRLRTGLIML